MPASQIEPFVRSIGTGLFAAIVLIVFGAIDKSLYPGLAMGPFIYVSMAVGLALILPSLAVLVRRLQIATPRGRSPWLQVFLVRSRRARQKDAEVYYAHRK